MCLAVSSPPVVWLVEATALLPTTAAMMLSVNTGVHVRGEFSVDCEALPTRGSRVPILDVPAAAAGKRAMEPGVCAPWKARLGMPEVWAPCVELVCCAEAAELVEGTEGLVCVLTAAAASGLVVCERGAGGGEMVSVSGVAWGTGRVLYEQLHIR